MIISMPRVKHEMRLWRCPVCGLEQEALAIEVGHKCPQRAIQPAPAKGKRKLPEFVMFDLVSKNGSIEPQVRDLPKTAKTARISSPAAKAPRQSSYLRMVIKSSGAK